MRTADHGEMGLSHGGLRQKAFNAYEETINVPLVVSNPVLFPGPGADRGARVAGRPAADDALARRRRGPGRPARARPDARCSPTPPSPSARPATRAEVDLAPVLDHAGPAPSVQDAIHFTYDDHQAATALQNAPGQPNRVRAVRTRRRQVRDLLRPRGQGVDRVRALRPRARPGRGRQPARGAHRRAQGRGRGGTALADGRTARRLDGRARHRAALSRLVEAPRSPRRRSPRDPRAAGNGRASAGARSAPAAAARSAPRAPRWSRPGPEGPRRS